MKKNHLMFLFIILTVFGISIGSVTNAIMSTPIDILVVTLDKEDTAMSNAIDALREENEHLSIVRYGSHEYYRIIALQYINNLVLIGHGNSNYGVIINGQYNSWEKYSSIVNGIKTKSIHFLNCGSDMIKNYVSNSVTTLPDNFDAKLAGYLTSFMIEKKFSIAKKLMFHMSKLQKGTIKVHFLGNKLGGWDYRIFSTNTNVHNELSGTVLFLLLTILQTGGFFIKPTTLTQLYSTEAKYVLMRAWPMFSKIITAGSWLVKIIGVINSWDAIINAIKTNLVSFGKAIVDFTVEVLADATFWDILIGILGFAIITKILIFLGNWVSGSGYAVAILNALVGFGSWVFGLVVDLNDCDHNYYSTTGVDHAGCSSSSSSSNSGSGRGFY